MYNGTVHSPSHKGRRVRDREIEMQRQNRKDSRALELCEGLCNLTVPLYETVIKVKIVNDANIMCNL